MDLALLGPGVRAGFTGADLDLAAQNGPAALAERLGRPVVLARQVHGTDLTWVDQVPKTTIHDAGPCDALATSLGGVALVVWTADCVPVLLADPAAGLVAAVHAGWRGVFARIVPLTVAKLTQRGASDLRAGIGPGICARCYRVGQDLADRFAAAGLPVSQAGDGGPSLDLPAGVAAQLRQAGVDRIATTDHCTKCTPGYFSFRGQGKAAGRQSGWISLDS